MMYFHYDPILGLIYHFFIENITIDLDILGKHLDPKELLEMWSKRGLILKNSFEETHPVIILRDIKCNLFDCQLGFDFAPVKKSSYDGVKVGNHFISDEAGLWPTPMETYESLDELALSFDRE